MEKVTIQLSEKEIQKLNLLKEFMIQQDAEGVTYENILRAALNDLYLNFTKIDSFKEKSVQR